LGKISEVSIRDFDQYIILRSGGKTLWDWDAGGGENMGMSLGDLTQAIRQHIDEEMDAEVACGMAEHALGFFGFYDRIIDNALEPTDRNLFYMFQDYELLTTESEETTLWDGREWRIHYWKFKPELRDKVEAYMSRKTTDVEIDPFQEVYTDMGRQFWMREKDKPVNPNAFTSDYW